jgi:dihydrofolate synthase / folylpolyglutamate synthase
VTYQEVEYYLCNQIPMFQKHGKSAYKEDLSNTLKLAALFDHPEKKFKSIHIAGTNGKGSSAHMSAALLQAKGYKVGLYTSPHLIDFRERIRINGEFVEKQFVVDFVERIKDFIEGEKPSFFEVTTIMAFEYFAQQEVDYGVIEVGLGGRLDCTNIITPVLSIITNIGLDHVDILGNDIREIAKEKAGIIKRGVPVCYQENQPEVLEVLERLSKENSVSPYLCKASEVEVYENELPLKGGNQLKNLSSVLKGLSLVLGEDLSDSDVMKGFSLMENELKLTGRWETINESPRVILDTAHNVPAFEAMLNQLKNESFKQLIFVLAFMQDKDVVNILSMLPKDAKYYFASFRHPRALYATHLKEIAKSKAIYGEEFGKVDIAYRTALECADKGDLIIIAGSNFILENLLIQKNNKKL